MTQVLTRKRSLGTWLKNYYEGGLLYHLFIASIVASSLDILTTWILLSWWPDICSESIPLSATFIEVLGLRQGLLLLLVLRILVSIMLYNSTYRIRTRLIGLATLTTGGSYLTGKHFYFIYMLLAI